MAVTRPGTSDADGYGFVGMQATCDRDRLVDLPSLRGHRLDRERLGRFGCGGFGFLLLARAAGKQNPADYKKYRVLRFHIAVLFAHVLS